MVDSTNVTLTNVVSMGAAMTGFSSVNSTALVLTGCSIDAGSQGISFIRSSNLRIDLCQVNGSHGLISMSGTSDVIVTDCLLTSGTDALVLVECTNVTVTTTSVFEASVAVDIINSMQVVLRDSSLSQMDATAVQIRNGSRDCSLINLTIVSSPTAVRIIGNQTHNNRIDHLVLSNCSVGVDLTDSGMSNVLANTVFFGTPRAVVATSGSDLDIQDGSFYDCPMAIDGDAVSDVSWTCNGHSELVNSSARFRGWFTVNPGGSLNISHGNLTFLGLSSSDSGISSSLLSALRIVNGSRLWGGGSLAPYSVRSRGSLVVQSSAFHGGGTASSGTTGSRCS
jgi:hypothetical protein